MAIAGEVLELQNVISPDQRATRITEKWLQWETLRQNKKTDWEEIRRYVYQTDTTQTTNAQLPWKNKTSIPKLCQIMDNLIANYMATIFPKRSRDIIWEGANKKDATLMKTTAISNYMAWVITQTPFKQELSKIIHDYVQMGNCFAMPKWIDNRMLLEDGQTKVGYVGPGALRISPLDMVFNPTADSFVDSPKIIRSVVSMGKLRKLLKEMSNDDNKEEYEKLYEYLKEIRFRARTFQGDWIQRDHLYQMDGFTSFRAYLMSDFVEILTFYGDYYDYVNDEFQENRVITVVDRHKLINDKPNPSFFGQAPIYHVAWRMKQDNLWGMGPLDNLIGMQYRLDHLENMKADVFDLITYPVQKIKGFVEDFTWQPGEKIFVSEDGDVELVVPDVNALNANTESQYLMQLMEEMAGAPKEAMGFRSPGEKTKYEVQRLENASSRIFQNKIKQFEEHMLEPLLNAMLELARRNMSQTATIPVFDDEFNYNTFTTLSVDDITGVGRIRPVAARHFAEEAELIQNMTSLTGSNLWPVVQPHFSGIKLAQIIEESFDLTEYEAVQPFVALAEQAEGQKMAQALEEQIHQSTMTATGMGHDFDQGPTGGPTASGPPMGLQRNPPANATPQGTLGTL
jgi:hypothetical protein